MIELKPRYFVLPAIALTVFAMLHPADGGRAATPCGMHSSDPGIRASFANFKRTQSTTAVRACALAANNLSEH